MEQSGIYKITNLVNNKCYIGLSKNVKNRLRNHKKCLKGNYHSNKHLQSAYNKYGSENFTFAPLEFLPIEKLSEMEKFYINKYNSIIEGYNKREGGYDKWKISEETRLKISKANKGKIISQEMRDKISQTLTGRKKSDESKAKQSESTKGDKNINFGRKFSEETRNKMSIAKTGVHPTKEQINTMMKARYPDKILTEEQLYEVYALFKDEKYTKTKLGIMFNLDRKTIAKKLKLIEELMKMKGVDNYAIATN